LILSSLDKSAQDYFTTELLNSPLAMLLVSNKKGYFETITILGYMCMYMHQFIKKFYRLTYVNKKQKKCKNVFFFIELEERRKTMSYVSICTTDWTYVEACALGNYGYCSKIKF
jgi:hypothetical protein